MTQTQRRWLAALLLGLIAVGWRMGYATSDVAPQPIVGTPEVTGDLSTAEFVHISLPVYEEDIREGTIKRSDPLLSLDGQGQHRWQAEVRLSDGQISGWSEGQDSSGFFLKVNEGGIYTLLDDQRNEVAALAWYVPHGVVPGEYGDYVSLSISDTGVIRNWPEVVDLDEFDSRRLEQDQAPLSLENARWEPFEIDGVRGLLPVGIGTEANYKPQSSFSTASLGSVRGSGVAAQDLNLQSPRTEIEIYELSGREDWTGTELTRLFGGIATLDFPTQICDRDVLAGRQSIAGATALAVVLSLGEQTYVGFDLFAGSEATAIMAKLLDSAESIQTGESLFACDLNTLTAAIEDIPAD